MVLHPSISQNLIFFSQSKPKSYHFQKSQFESCWCFEFYWFHYVIAGVLLSFKAKFSVHLALWPSYFVVWSQNDMSKKLRSMPHAEFAAPKSPLIPTQPFTPTSRELHLNAVFRLQTHNPDSCFESPILLTVAFLKILTHKMGEGQ